MIEQNEKSKSTKDQKDLKDTKDGVKSSLQSDKGAGESRSASSGDTRALNDTFSTTNVKPQSKDPTGGMKDAAGERSVEIKDVVVGKAVAVKDAVVDKAIEVKDVAAEKVSTATDVVVDTLQDVGDQTMRAGSATWRFTKANAIPLALLGVGAGLLISRSRKANRDERDYLEQDEASSDARNIVTPSSMPSTPTPMQGRVRGTGPTNGRDKAARAAGRKSAGTQGAKSRAGDSLARAEQAVADGAARGADYVQDKALRTADYVREKASLSADYVQAKLRRAGSATQDFATANPMVVAMATLAAGVGVGMLLPATDRENKLLAPSRAKFRTLLGDVRDVATDVAQVAKDTASDSLRAVT